MKNPALLHALVALLRGSRGRVCLAGLGIGAVLLLTPAGAGSGNEEELWRHRNLGKALFETPATMSQAPAELKKALELAPDSFRDRLNYGLALLRTGDLDAAIAELEKAQKLNPDLPHTWFNLGVAYKRKGRRADAQRQFERMAQMIPDEPVVHYNLGLLYGLAGRKSDALKEFEISANLDRKLVAPRFKIYEYYRIEDDMASAARALKDFQRAKEDQQERGDAEDMEWCYYAELYDPIEARPPGRDPSPPAELKFEDRRLGGKVDANTAGLLTIGSGSDRAPDLLVWSQMGAKLYRGGRDEIHDSGLAGLEGIVAVAPGDFDNDGLTDLCVLTDQGPRLFHNAKGAFEEVKSSLPQERFDFALWFDFDHDYDPDLFLLGAKSYLFRNEGQGRLTDYTSHFPFAQGRAVAAAYLRRIPDSKGIDLAVSYDGNHGVLYRDELQGKFTPVPLDAIPPKSTDLHVIDVDNDGWLDLAFTSAGKTVLARNREGRFERVNTPASGPFEFSDLENRGRLDLIAGSGIHRNAGLAKFTAARVPAGFPAAVRWAEADFDSDGRSDLAAVADDGTVHVLLNRTGLKHEWLRISLAGVKNAKSGRGAEVEVKAGDAYEKRVYESVPLVFGLGLRKQVDTVRITWPNGLIQNQTEVGASRGAVYEEAPRLSGSCPMVFTWNGREFQFITDVLGVAPLGASSGDGEYFPVDHDEYVRIPGEALKARDGRYEVRITEELHEVSYLDKVQLIALDHPADVEVYTNEKFKSPPFPEFRLFGVSRRIRPAAAVNDDGRSVLPALLREDGVYARGFAHGHAGVAAPHTLTLDFGQKAARSRGSVLYLTGWVDWADGSTFFAESQSGKGLVMPYLQVKDAEGNWTTVIEDMGIPAGKPKTIAVDLTGKFRGASREVRIVTNLCVYWDEIFLGEDTAPPSVSMTPISAASADLRLRGFSIPVIDARRERPEIFQYAKWTPTAIWDQTPGLYTRYGDVRELVHSVDDRMVIMGSGDELALYFDGRGLPPLPGGWRRDFLLLVDGWAKDSDANTAFSQSVEPLPFHGMSRYPYPVTEHYPDDPAHREYRKTYNTRPALRFVSPLVAGARSR
jgi:tetratricopeptide (TPR) repeat protein